MNGDQMVNQLPRSNPQQREDIIENLHCALLLNGGRVPFKNTEQSMRQLSQVLAENHTDGSSAIICLQFIADLIPLLGSELDRCMDVIMDSLMSCLAIENKTKIRDAALEVLQKYSFHSESLDRVSRSIISHGIRASDVKIRRSAIKHVPDIYIKKISSGKLGDIITALIRCLSEAEVKSEASVSLNRLKDLCGKSLFESYIRNLPETLKKQYESSIKTDSSTNYNATSSKNDSDLLDMFFATNAPKKNKTTVNNSIKIDYGIFSSHLTVGANDKSDIKKRVSSIDEIRSMLEETKRLDDFKPHVRDFILLQDELLNDKNLKVISSTLDVLFVVVDRVGRGIKPESGLVVSVLTKRMPERNRAIRQSIMKIFVRLSQAVTPRVVLSNISEHIGHSDLLIRQECLNVIITILLSCNLSDIDSPFLCNIICRSLTDTKRPVRQASLEAAAVLARLLGPSRKSELLKAAAEVERRGSQADRGLSVAVESRISPGKPLPTLDSGGLVEYGISASRSAATSPDVEWILGSAGDTRGSMDLSWLEPYAPSTVNGSVGKHHRPSVASRKSCVGLPWETNGGKVRSQYSGEVDVSKTIAQDLMSHTNSNYGLDTIKPLSGGRQQSIKKKSDSLNHNKAQTDDYLNFLFKSEPNETNSEVGVSQKKKPNGKYSREKYYGESPVIPMLEDYSPVRDSYNLMSQRSMDESTAVLRTCGSAGKKRVNRIFGKLEHKEREGEMGGFKSEGDLPSLVLKSAGGDSPLNYQRDKPLASHASHSKLDSSSPMLGKAQLARKGSMRSAGKTGSSSAGTERSAGRDVSSAGGRGGWGPVKFSLGGLDDEEEMGGGKLKPPSHSAPTDDRPIKPMTDYSIYEPANGVAEVPLRRTKSQHNRNFNNKTDSRGVTSGTGMQAYRASNIEQGDSDQTVLRSPVRQRPKPLHKSTPTSPSEHDIGQGEYKVKDNSEDIDPADLSPCKNPNSVLNEALQQMANEDWETKCRGLNNVRRLATHHPETLTSQLHTVVVAVIAEVKSLRSVVAILAMKSLGCMYSNLKRSMETDLEHTVNVLLQKTADTNNFIREEASNSLNCMVASINPQKSMVSLITTGAGHKNTVVRTAASSLMAGLVESLRCDRVYVVLKDSMDKLMKSATQFLSDGSITTRYNGQRIMYVLMGHPDFDRIISKHVTVESLRSVQDKLDNLRNKGLPDPPVDVNATRQRGSTAFPDRRGSMRGYSAPSALNGRVTSGDSGDGASNKVYQFSNARRRRSQKIDESTQDDITDMMARMGANDFRERLAAIEQFKDLSTRNTSAVGANITKIFDKLVGCLRDSNSKVNLSALQTLSDLIPVLSKHLTASVLNLTVPSLVANLASTKTDIHSAASNCLDQLASNIDTAILLPVFTNQTQSSNSRCKADMVNRVTDLVSLGGSQKQLSMHVLPLVWHLIGQSAGSSRANSAGPGNLNAATSNLVNTLYGVMGEGLFDAAAANSKMTPAMQQVLKSFVV